MNHTTLTLVAVLAAVAVVIGGTFTTVVASPAFALDGSSSSSSTDRQDASNCIGVANDGANPCRQQATGDSQAPE